MTAPVPMDHLDCCFIDGAFRAARGGRFLDVIDPATERTVASIAPGNAEDVDDAVAAARRAFASFAVSAREERIALLERILAAYDRHAEEMARRMVIEMGTPITFSREAQTPAGRAHIVETIEALRRFDLSAVRNGTLLEREPVGVCGLITPWNWPILQVITKVAPAIAAGCCVVLKPSELSPLSALLFAEIMREAETPPGVFNLVNGDGAEVGTAISTHPGIDMVSFTGSTRAGILVARNAADTVKRVHQELGGKSANILLPEVDLPAAVERGVAGCFLNNGQSCSAPTRMFVPRALHAEAARLAGRAADAFRVGDTADEAVTLGPVVNRSQYDRIQRLIQAGIDEGAQLVAGGTGLPDGCTRGFFVRPTVFANVRPDMAVAREEIFGPVLCLIPYDTVDEAVSMANDTDYGLAGYVQGRNMLETRTVARRLRVGNVYLNGATPDLSAPFGGYKRSGNGREYGEYGIEAFLEVKAVAGYEAA